MDAAQRRISTVLGHVAPLHNQQFVSSAPTAAASGTHIFIDRAFKFMLDYST
jgi:hypothetical protein